MRRLGGPDAAFLYGETPNWHMHISGLQILDPTTSPDGWSFERYRQILIERLPEVPQLRWKLVEVPFGVDRPGWVEDPDVDVDQHLRRVGLPSPGGQAELHTMAGQIMALKIDRSRPLWEVWVIEGLADDKVAVLMKMHHSIVDGMTGAGLSEVMLDLTPEPRPPSGETVERIPDERIPSDLELFAGGIVRNVVASPRRTLRFARQSIRQALAAREHFGGEVQPTIPMNTPRTVLNQDPSPRRRFASATVELDRAKRIKDAADVKLNDVILALCSSAIRTYLDKHDALPDATLVAQFPVSLRTEGDTDVGNKIGSMFAELATEEPDPLARLQRIHRSTTAAKAMRQAMSAHQIMGITEIMAPGWIALAARTFTRSGLMNRTPAMVNVAVSNTPGPAKKLYIAGCEVEAMYPMGPLVMGMSLCITVMSYAENLDFGFVVCPEAIPDPELFGEGLIQGVTDLEDALGL